MLRSWAGRATIAHAALAHFRAELAARGLAPRRLVLAGHSEGSVVASVIVAEGAVADGVVLLSGPSVGIISIMTEQMGSAAALGAIEGMPPDAQQYMRDCDATDPVAMIAGYEKPVLIVQGGADTSVPVHHAEALRAERGSRPTTYRFFPGLSHMYKVVPPG
ncbi:MAG: alpha/beta hydrolase family protein, partial [Gemmatimonadaceae bacterium]